MYRRFRISFFRIISGWYFNHGISRILKQAIQVGKGHINFFFRVLNYFIPGYRSENRSKMTEVREQRSENRGQKTEVRKQRSENRSQKKTEVRKQRSENRSQKTEVRGN